MIFHARRREREGEFRQVLFGATETGFWTGKRDLPIAFFPCPDLLLPYPGF
jgi:hypothetical protein